jgi:hypothetical protein
VIAICAGVADESAMEVIGAERFAERFAAIDAEPLGDNPVMEICRLLEHRAWIPPAAAPSTEGDGI